MQKTLIGLVAVLVVIAGVWAFSNQDSATDIANAPEDNTASSETSESMVQEETNSSDTSTMVAGDSNAYTVNTNKSQVEWYGEKKIGGGHNGAISLSEGKIYVDANGAISEGSFSIDMTSITNEDLEGVSAQSLITHFESDDFFSVETYPTAMFEINSVNETETDNQYMVVGDLTIKNITHEISFPAKITTTEDTMQVSAEFSLDRSLWDIRYGSASFFSDLGDKVISDQMDLTLDIVLEQN